MLKYVLILNVYSFFRKVMSEVFSSNHHRAIGPLTQTSTREAKVVCPSVSAPFNQVVKDRGANPHRQGRRHSALRRNATFNKSGSVVSPNLPNHWKPRQDAKLLCRSRFRRAPSINCLSSRQLSVSIREQIRP